MIKKGIRNRITAAFLTIVMCVCSLATVVHADETTAPEENTGKYVKEVFMANGESREDAEKWLTEHGWEPIKGENDFNAGKNSKWDDPMAVAMGIKRTDDPKEAITDMAVMNMKGGYSLPAYEELVTQKKTEIDEFINSFMITIQEFRDNYNNKGSESGKARADMAYSILNKFTDGDSNERYPVNDTNLPLGEMLMDQTRQEGNTAGGDLQQIILESSGPAMTAIETLVALGADPNEETWIERLQNLSGDDLSKNIGLYVPEVARQNLAPSALINELNATFGDAARALAMGWSDVHDSMVWYENYNEENDLWQYDDEDGEAYAARVDQYFTDMQAANEDRFDEESTRYSNVGMFYNNLYDTEYEGEWGETLGDFFNPYDGSDYSLEPDLFLPMAAALSPGQRAALDFISLSALVKIGFGTTEAIEEMRDDVEEIFDGAETLSVYSGINRGIFRGGVAITSQALMEQNMGKGDAFAEMWDITNVYNILTYAGVVISVAAMISGAIMAVKGTTYVGRDAAQMSIASRNLNNAKSNLAQLLKTNTSEEAIERGRSAVENWKIELNEAKGTKQISGSGYAGRVMVGLGGAILIGVAIYKAVQLYQYYQKTFTPIPLYIVDEADIVTYITDEDGNPVLDANGNQKKSIDFKDYQYYEAVKCNRQDVGKLSDWQDGVDDYKKKGCGDVADLNGDFGQEWLALYTVKSPDKGNPILADSLTLQYGSEEQPEGTTKCLHFFEYTYPIDLGDTAYSYNNKKGGVYFFWDEDAEAENNGVTASAFSAGHMAMVGAVGLVIGILAATFVLLPQRKKETLD